MGSSRRNRDRRPARRAATRDPRRRLLVVCEGEVTEPTYIRGWYEKLVRNASVQIKVERAGGVPLTLVRTAVRLKEEAEGEAKRSDDGFAAYDEVWCVFDVDDHPHIPDAKQLAAGNGIELAISNPCFELWLILHFRDSPGPHHRNTYGRELKGATLKAEDLGAQPRIVARIDKWLAATGNELLKDGGFNHYRVPQALLQSLDANSFKPEELVRFERLFRRIAEVL